MKSEHTNRPDEEQLCEVKGISVHTLSVAWLPAHFRQDLSRTSVSEAIGWHLLGRVAQEQKEWAEAEHCFRESLKLKERVGDTAGIPATYNELALVAEEAGRPSEAESWYKRALELDKQVHPGHLFHANHLNNFANLLTNEVRAGHAPTTRLAEAKGYAEQALAIKETLDTSAQIWTVLSVLANIAKMEGQLDSARGYRRRGREAYAAFVGNRYRIDQQFGELIEALAAATGDMPLRERIEEVFPRLEANDWQIAAAIRRIWAGEREWHALVDDLSNPASLLVLRVLETLGYDKDS